MYLFYSDRTDRTADITHHDIYHDFTTVVDEGRVRDERHM